MFEWFTEFMESPLGKLISTGILAVAVLLLTLAAAGLVNRLMKKLVDRHRKTNSSIATVLGFVRYIAVAAVYFAGGMVIVGAIPVLSSAVRTLLATGGVIAVVAGLAAQEALGSVVSGVMTGRCERKTTVRQIGGETRVEWNDSGNVFLTAPSVHVFDGTIRLDEEVFGA